MPPEFLGYERLDNDSTVIHLYQDGKAVDTLAEGDEGVLILDKTPFYAESGGQVGELGEISTESGVFDVLDTQKSGQAIIHHGVVKMGHINNNQSATAQVASQVRASSAKTTLPLICYTPLYAPYWAMGLAKRLNGEQRFASF